ncbi:hypothetical protein GAYE_SCF03G2319 [Galdieria yellowstonensis]|uniref:Uncharacterized protein n=1 Tax=Galdieria yellowstonensis TaxID=3028027 RepID=A0AAV9IAP9_9RHOD|nr:hypothetical protein GAYE_SCF03G2319 [Galdieria yellowstonensis]
MVGLFPTNKALLYSYRLPFMSLNQGSESSSASDYDGGDKCIDNNGTVVGRRLGEAWFYSKDDAYVSK